MHQLFLRFLAVANCDLSGRHGESLCDCWCNEGLAGLA